MNKQYNELDVLVMQAHKGSHVAFRLNAHIIFVTKYRERRFTDLHLQTLERILSKLCADRKALVVEFNGEPDHVHMLIDYHPATAISSLVNALKSVSGREMKLYHPELNQPAWRKNALWSAGYFACSVGGAPIEVLKRYIQQQERPH